MSSHNTPPVPDGAPSWRARVLTPSEATVALAAVPHPSHKTLEHLELPWPEDSSPHDHVEVRTMHPTSELGDKVVLIELAVRRPDQPRADGDSPPTSWVEHRVHLTVQQVDELAEVLEAAAEVATDAMARASRMKIARRRQ